jgi:MFS family permease
VGISGKLIHKFNPKVVLACGGATAITLITISSFCKRFELWYIFYAFGYGMGSGSTYILPVHHSWLWFPRSPGTVSGIILAGFGLA